MRLKRFENLPETSDLNDQYPYLDPREVLARRLGFFAIGAAGGFVVAFGALALLSWFWAFVALELGPRAVEKFWSAAPLSRAMVVVPVFWVLIAGAFVIVFEPYGYMHSREVAHMMKIVFFPPAILVAGYFAYKIILGPDRKSKE